jgi:hypothetical protein
MISEVCANSSGQGRILAVTDEKSETGGVTRERQAEGKHMKTGRRVILLEFNELSPSLMHRFMAAGELPNFQRFHRESLVYLTEAEERTPYLNPWIQWVTVHSGLNYRDHRIVHLDEGAKLTEKWLWDLISDAGLSVWVCGSMNVAYHAPINGLVLPDPWTTNVRPYPSELKSFFRFVQTSVLEHTNDQTPLGLADYLQFMAFVSSHGLSLRTVGGIVQQILSERCGKNRWKRVALLDKLQFDVFAWYYRKKKPHFSTFFSNSTAHYQHFYWREMEPELFKIQPTQQERAAYETAIRFGYQEMDKLLGRFLEIADLETTLMFCTAISQQPCLTYEDQGGKVGYRPREFSRLMHFAGVSDPHVVAPVMAEQFNAYFQNEDDGERAEQKLLALRVDGRPAMMVERTGAQLHVGCRLHQRLPQDTRLCIEGDPISVPFFSMFYLIEGMKSGMHHPDGMLWIRTPERRHLVHDRKVPLCSVAPTILTMFSLPHPNYMQGPVLEHC